jgi:hypothetical protein
MYGVALVVALVAAYLSWTYESEADLESKDAVVIVDAKPEKLAAVVYEEDDLTVRLEPREDDHGEYVWAETSRTKASEPKAPPASKPHHHDGDAGHDDDAGTHDDTPDTPEKPDEPKVEKKAFKAGTKGTDVVEAMAPFRAIRKLEGATKDRYESFGLDEPRGTLTLELEGGATHTFEVGGEGYGHRNIYIRDTKTDAIYLVEANSLRPLRYADTRMAEKLVHGHDRDELVELIITDGTARLEAEQKNRDDLRNRMWVPKGEDNRNVPLETWIQKFERMRGTEYAAEGDVEQTDKVLSVKLVADKGKSTTVDLLRGQTADGTPAWYVKSDFTRGVMQVPTAIGSDLANDFPTVVEAVKEGGSADEAPAAAE